MYDILKQVSEDQLLAFTYARKDFQNLYDEVEDNVPHIFLDPVQTQEEYDEYFNVTGRTYSGSFVLVLSSNIEEGDYNTRYVKYIKPILEDKLRALRRGIISNQYNSAVQCLHIKSWNTTEVINLFDYNMDGVLVNFTIQSDELD